MQQSFWKKILSLFSSQSSPISEDEILQILEEGKKSGAIAPAEHELIKSILEFTDTTAKEIMVPRNDIVAMDIDTPREILIHKVIDEGYSRIPVYKESLDSIIGILYTKDLLGVLEHRDIIILHDILRPPYFIPEFKKISELLGDLQSKKQHLAIVVDEFGGTEGIVTIEDIVEEIVGEIHDEYDEEGRDIEKSSDGSLLVNGKISIHDFNEKFHAAIPEDNDYDTLSGFLQKHIGQIPELHQDIIYEHFIFTITKKNVRRIRQVKVKILKNSTTVANSIP